MAQGTAPAATAPVSAEPMYTLHVYEDLVQVTALVMAEGRRVVTHLQSDDFNMRLDAGPVFHPRHLRLAGDDPLSLAVVLDESWPGAEESTRALGESLAHLPSGLLTARDHVSIFAFDCNLLMPVREMPALSPSLPALLPKLLSAGALHGAVDGHSRCAKSVSLWDALAAVGSQLEAVKGRRVLLVVTPGLDSGSANRPDALRHFLAGEGTSVFSAVPIKDNTKFSDLEPPLARLCTGTGGLTTTVRTTTLSTWLEETLKLVRERYVLEFARPSNESVGLHQLDITMRRQTEHAYVSGVTVPIRNQQIEQDPYRVPNASEGSPVMGGRKILTPP